MNPAMILRMKRGPKAHFERRNDKKREVAVAAITKA
jgi:hypothetical protein